MNESLKNKHRIEHLLVGDILDLGAGRWPICKGAITYDLRHHGNQGCRAAVIGDARSLIFGYNRFDVVHSSHLLEDLGDTRSVLVEWLRVLRPHGHLILYLPHRDHYPNIGQPFANTDHQHDFVPEDILAHLTSIGQTSIELCETFPPSGGKYNPAKSKTDEYSFLIVARKGFLTPW